MLAWVGAFKIGIARAVSPRSTARFGLRLALGRAMQFWAHPRFGPCKKVGGVVDRAIVPNPVRAAATVNGVLGQRSG
jgi:hypothetical protein